MASLVTLPLPTAPTWVTEAPSLARIGFTWLNTSSGPPTMMASVASTAFGSPPLTGASNIGIPFCASLAATSWLAAGAIELMSTTIDPGCTPSITPPWPSTASFTCGELGSMVMITSLRAATSLGDNPAFAPAATSSAMGSGRTSKTVTS